MQDLNTFGVGQIVNVGDIPEYQSVQIDRISDSGVTVSGGKVREVILSGRSPAVLSDPNAPKVIAPEPINLEQKQSISQTKPTGPTPKPIYKMNDPLNAAIKPINSAEAPMQKPARHSYKDQMSKLVMPEVQPFTVRTFSELNHIPQAYAFNWIKENCVEAGQAPKPFGQRGRAATLYNLKVKA